MPKLIGPKFLTSSGKSIYKITAMNKEWMGTQLIHSTWVLRILHKIKFKLTAQKNYSSLSTQGKTYKPMHNCKCKYATLCLKWLKPSKLKVSKHSHSVSAFVAAAVSCSTIRGTTSARVTPPTASISARASQLGVGIPPPVLKPWGPVSDKILAR